MNQTRRYRWFVVVALLCAVLALAGCAFLEKRSSLSIAVDTYATTLTVLAEYRAAGLLSEKAIERIDVARVLIRQALDDWREAQETDKSPSRAIGNFTEAMSVLIEERLAAKGRE